jgi:hypothetical protein
VEICGYGRVAKAELERTLAQEGDALPAWAKAAEAAQARRADLARTQLAARLAVGNDADRVAGRLIMGDRDGAALIAAQSQDATAYRLGLGACGYGEGVEDEAACRGLSIQGWIDRDASDARPWLEVANRAMRKGDEATATAALEEAARRPAWSEGEPLMVIAMAAAPAVVTDRVDLGLLSVQLMGQQAVQPDWSSIGLSRYCSAARVKDEQRLPLCRQLSIQVMNGANTLFDAQLAQKVADRVGVPAEQQRFDAATLRAAQERFYEDATSGSVGFDCASTSRFADHFAERAKRGELQMALDLLKGRNPQRPLASAASASKP